MNKLSEFDYYEPATLAEAYDLLEKFGTEAKVLAGGTDMLVMNKKSAFAKVEKSDCNVHNRLIADTCATTTEVKRVYDLKNVINLKKIKPILNEIAVKGDKLTIGALATMTQINLNESVKKHFPALAAAAGRMGSPLVRNIATMGGNVANSSPAGETLFVLLALEAKVLVGGKAGNRTIDINDFFVHVGKNSLKPGEIILAFELESTGSCNAYKRFSPRHSMDLVVVGVCANLWMDGKVCKKANIGLGAVAITPIHAVSAEKYLVGKELTDDVIKEAAKLAAGDAKPISDIRASAEYRTHLVEVLTKRTIKEALA